jgi:hypothetical protein
MNDEGKEQPDQATAVPGLFSRYIRIFVAPDLLFQGLRTQPLWGGAMLLGACLVLAGTGLIPPELFIATLRESGQDLPPGLEDQGNVFRLAGAAAAFIFWSISLAIFAGVIMVIFAFLLGHEGTYRQYLAVIAHAQLISATSTVVLLPLRIIAEDAQLVLSVGTFAVFLDSGYPLRFLSALDLFGLWAWLLVGLGAARIGRKKSWIGASVIVMVIPVTIATVVAIFTG